MFCTTEPQKVSGTESDRYVLETAGAEAEDRVAWGMYRWAPRPPPCACEPATCPSLPEAACSPERTSPEAAAAGGRET